MDVIKSVIILVINKSDSRCVVVRFCYHSYDYRLNWTPLSPITITKKAWRSNCVHGSVFQWVSMSPTNRRTHWDNRRLNRRVSVNIALKFPNFYRTLSSLDSIFIRDWYDSYSFIREANFRFFTHWCIFIRSSLFRFFELVQGVFRGPCLLITYN